jgi:hypothetical protein
VSSQYGREGDERAAGPRRPAALRPRRAQPPRRGRCTRSRLRSGGVGAAGVAPGDGWAGGVCDMHTGSVYTIFTYNDKMKWRRVGVHPRAGRRRSCAQRLRRRVRGPRAAPPSRLQVAARRLAPAERGRCRLARRGGAQGARPRASPGRRRKCQWLQVKIVRLFTDSRIIKRSNQERRARERLRS